MYELCPIFTRTEVSSVPCIHTSPPYLHPPRPIHTPTQDAISRKIVTRESLQENARQARNHRCALRVAASLRSSFTTAARASGFTPLSVSSSRRLSVLRSSPVSRIVEISCNTGQIMQKGTIIDRAFVRPPYLLGRKYLDSRVWRGTR